MRTNRLVFMEEIIAALDRAEKESAGISCCLVTTSTGKFYSNGLDLSWLLEQEDPQGKAQELMLSTFHKLLRRVMTFPMPTVAAVNGHAMAGGWLLALAHDYRIMNNEKGFVCMTEIDIGARLTKPLNAFIRAKLPRWLAAKLLLEGCRLNAQQSMELGMLDAAVPASQVLDVAIKQGQSMAPKAAGGIMGQMKYDLYEDACQALESGPIMPSSL